MDNRIPIYPDYREEFRYEDPKEEHMYQRAYNYTPNCNKIYSVATYVRINIDDIWYLLLVSNKISINIDEKSHEDLAKAIALKDFHKHAYICQQVSTNADQMERDPIQLSERERYSLSHSFKEDQQYFVNYFSSL